MRSKAKNAGCCLGHRRNPFRSPGRCPFPARRPEGVVCRGPRRNPHRCIARLRPAPARGHPHLGSGLEKSNHKRGIAGHPGVHRHRPGRLHHDLGPGWIGYLRQPVRRGSGRHRGPDLDRRGRCAERGSEPGTRGEAHPAHEHRGGPGSIKLRRQGAAHRLPGARGPGPHSTGGGEHPPPRGGAHQHHR